MLRFCKRYALIYVQKDLKWQQKELINRQKLAVFAHTAFVRAWPQKADVMF